MGGERPANATAVADEEREGSGITIEILQQHFHQPLVTVAEELGVSLTVSEAENNPSLLLMMGANLGGGSGPRAIIFVFFFVNTGER